MSFDLKAIDSSSQTEKKIKTQFDLFKSIKTTPIRGKDRMFFTEQLALMLETGNNLHASLTALGKQIQNPAFAQTIASLEQDISEGKTFSAALAKFPEIFSSSYINLIAASEEGGYMYKALESLLQMERQSEELRTTVKSALTYPAFLIVFSISVIIFILTVVFPKFESLFSSIQDELPVTTVALLWLSDLLITRWWLLLAALATLLGGLVFWKKTPSGLRILDGLKLKLPLLKNIFIKIYFIQTFQILGLSLANGVNLLDAIKASEDVVKNSVFRSFIDQLCQNVTDGKGFSIGFQQSTFIPPIVQQMVETGEATGNLALVLSRVADYFQRELSERLTMLSKLIEPLMLIVMGTIVGLLVSSIILPIFKLSRIAH